ncbi:hypothetical protein FRC00_004238 [Tulasnella sp. 408]|nr:hypothetical protein FRC00_004238 [Tulasnella sp. 408]
MDQQATTDMKPIASAPQSECVEPCLEHQISPLTFTTLGRDPSPARPPPPLQTQPAQVPSPSSDTPATTMDQQATTDTKPIASAPKSKRKRHPPKTAKTMAQQAPAVMKPIAGAPKFNPLWLRRDPAKPPLPLQPQPQMPPGPRG